jgi:hypothetical protein
VSARLGLALLVAVGTASPLVAAPASSATEERSDVRPLPFIADDYARALGDARARSLPLFIEAWAPW